jgi:hypothetical protein
MTYMRSNRVMHRRRHSRLWPLVAALWAAVGLSPCALAAVGDLDCLHCPVDAAAGHDNHAMHGEHADQGHDAPGHGGAAGDCGDDCLDAGDSLVDLRGYKSSEKDAGDHVGAATVLAFALPLVTAAKPGGVDPPAVVPLPRARLHALHCVYRD